MEIRAGQKLFSAVCGAGVIVVRAPSSAVVVACGGVPMLTEKPETSPGEPKGGDAGPKIGKRYVDLESGVEFLCTQSGDNPVTVDGREVSLKDAKPLPSSD
jgi:hypothetical protein